MKRTVIALLAFALFMTGTNAQETELIEDGIYLYGVDSLKLDSLYTYWNTYVQFHPKDEVAWRNLFEVSEKKVYRMNNDTKDWKGSVEYRK